MTHENEFDPRAFIDRLRESPLFFLSLASIELFHSNFLAWILRQKGTRLAKIMFPEQLQGVTDDMPLTCLREKKNIDLMIQVGDKTLIVENKIKSKPDLSQLRGIVEKQRPSSSDVQYILLSLIEPVFSASEMRPWALMSYGTLLDHLRVALSEGIFTGYEKEMLSDYVSFTSDIVGLCDAFKASLECSDDFLSWSGFTELKTIGLNSLLDKQRNSILCEAIRNRFKDDVFNTTSIWDCPNGKISVNPGFSSLARTGNVEIVRVFHGDRKVAVSIQIQSNKLQQMIHSRSDNMGIAPDKLQKLAEHLADENKWFFRSSDINHDETIYPKSGGFNKWSETCKLRYIKLLPRNLDGLLELIAKHVESLRGVSFDSKWLR